MVRWLKPFVFLACLIPLALLGWKALHDGLGANPIEFITHSTGDWTMRFLLITLAVTPLRKLLKQPWLVRYRRMFGLFAFFYGLLHFTTYIWLDKFFDLHEMLADIAKRKFITVGFLALAADGAAGADFDELVDPPTGRKALAGAAPADLFQRDCWRDSLHLAGEGRPHQAAAVRGNSGRASGVPPGGVGMAEAGRQETCDRRGQGLDGRASLERTGPGGKL